MPDYSQFEKGAIVAEQGLYTGAKGSEVERISPTGAGTFTDITATGALTMTGAITSATEKTDPWIFIPPSNCNFFGGTWTLTRNAAGDYSMNKTAAADTTYIGADYTGLFRAVTNKGLKPTGLDVIYSIGTDALVAHSAALYRVTYANNAAVAVAAYGGALAGGGALQTAVQAQPYHTALTSGSPLYNAIIDTSIRTEVTVQANATSVYKFYGFLVYYSFNYL